MDKRHAYLMSVGLLTAVFSLPGWSATNETQANPQTQTTPSQAEQPRNPLPSTLEAQGKSPMLVLTPADLMQREVINIKGENLGEVKEVRADQTTGDVYAVITMGGFMGIAAEKRLIPLDDLRFKGDMLHIDQTTEEVSNYPELDAEEHLTAIPADRPMNEYASPSASSGQRPAN